MTTTEQTAPAGRMPAAEMRAWALAGAGVLALFAVVFALGTIGWRVMTAPQLPDLAPTLQAINRPCPGKGEKHPAPCGTLADVNRTLASIRGTFGQIELAANHENANLTALDMQERQLAQDAHQTLQQAAGAIGGVQAAVTTANAQMEYVGPLLESLRASSDAVPPTLAAVQGMAVQGGAAFGSLRDLAADQHIREMVAHFDGMSASGDKMLADAQWKTHQLLHPDKVKLGFWGATWAGIKAVKQLEPPIL